MLLLLNFVLKYFKKPLLINIFETGQERKGTDHESFQINKFEIGFKYI